MLTDGPATSVSIAGRGVSFQHGFIQGGFARIVLPLHLCFVLTSCASINEHRTVSKQYITTEYRDLDSYQEDYLSVRVVGSGNYRDAEVQIKVEDLLICPEEKYEVYRITELIERQVTSNPLMIPAKIIAGGILAATAGGLFISSNTPTLLQQYPDATAEELASRSRSGNVAGVLFLIGGAGFAGSGIFDLARTKPTERDLGEKEMNHEVEEEVCDADPYSNVRVSVSSVIGTRSYTTDDDGRVFVPLVDLLDPDEPASTTVGEVVYRDIAKPIEVGREFINQVNEELMGRLYSEAMEDPGGQAHERYRALFPDSSGLSVLDAEFESLVVGEKIDSTRQAIRSGNIDEAASAIRDLLDFKPRRRGRLDPTIEEALPEVVETFRNRFSSSKIRKHSTAEIYCIQEIGADVMYSAFVSDPNRIMGEFVNFEAQIKQNLGGAYLVDIGGVWIYVQVSNSNVSTGFVDGAPVVVHGKAMGTSQYETVLGATKTVPYVLGYWIEPLY